MAIRRPRRIQYAPSSSSSSDPSSFRLLNNPTFLLVMAGIVGTFSPFGQATCSIHSIGGTLIISGCIVYDTYNINKRCSPDEFITGGINLYLQHVLRMGWFVSMF